MSERDLAADLAALFRAVTIRNAMEYAIAGRIFNLTTPATCGALAMTPLLAPLVADLQARLYDWAYCRRMHGEVDGVWPRHPQPIDDALSAANAGRERWEQGWQLVQLLPNGGAQARKGSRALLLQHGQFAAGHHPHPGAIAAVFLAKESKTLQPGFYYVFSETVPDAALEGRPTRIYFHIDEKGAPLLVAAISRELNRFGIPFRFKTLSHAGAYVRSDAAVLFFAKRHFAAIARLLPRIRDAVRDHLRPAAPLFAKSLAAGIAVAEDPGNGESFGMNRIRMVAQAIWDAHLRGFDSTSARLQELEVQFQQNGLRLDRPHLRGASEDLYELPA